MKSTLTKTLNKNEPKTNRLLPFVVMALSALFLFYKYVLQVSPSVMTDQLMRQFHINGAGMGNLAATFFYSYLVTQLFVGPLLDRYSPKWLTAGSIAVCGLGAVLFSHSTTLLDAALSRSLVGVGAAFATVSYMKNATTWFKPKHFAVVSGLLATAAMLGSMAAQKPMALLVNLVGWQNSLLYTGLLGLGFATLYALTAKDAKAHTQTTSNGFSWQEMGLVLKQPKNWCLMLYSGMAFAPLAVFGGLWGNPFLEVAYHLSTPQAAMLTTYMFFGLAVGGPVFGKVADLLKNRYLTMLLGLALSFVCLTTVLYTPVSQTAAGWLLFLFGFGTGAFMLGFTVAKELNNVALAATVVSLINTGDALFGAFSEPMVGHLLDTFWTGGVKHGVHYFSLHDFHVSLLALPCYLVAAGLCLLPFYNKS